jgi:hypothetical protein
VFAHDFAFYFLAGSLIGFFSGQSHFSQHLSPIMHLSSSHRFLHSMPQFGQEQGHGFSEQPANRAMAANKM